VTRFAAICAGVVLTAAVAGVAGAQDHHGRDGGARGQGRAERAAPYRGGGAGPYRGPPPGVVRQGGYGPAYGYASPPVYAPMRRPNSLGADWREQQDEARQGVRQGQLVPLGRVIEGIRRRTPGRQLDAGLESENGREVYRLRWMSPDGRRTDYIIDAATGALLRGR